MVELILNFAFLIVILILVILIFIKVNCKNCNCKNSTFYNGPAGSDDGPDSYAMW